MDVLKSYQGFWMSHENDLDDAKMLRAPIDLSHSRGLTVVAEGVENAKVWELLRELKCDQAQGFHMGRPMPVTEFSAWSTSWGMRRQAADSDGVQLLH